MLRAPAKALLARSLGFNSFAFTCSLPVSVSLADRFGQPVASSQHQARSFSSNSGYDHEVDLINEKFAEAREEIEFAREDAETVYFNESAEVARKAVAEVLDKWQDLLGKVSDDDQAKLQRSMGLKIEQLKAEMKELDELHA